MFYRKRIEKLERKIKELSINTANLLNGSNNLLDRMVDIQKGFDSSIDILRDRIRSFEKDNERVTKHAQNVESALNGFMNRFESHVKELDRMTRKVSELKTNSESDKEDLKQRLNGILNKTVELQKEIKDGDASAYKNMIEQFLGTIKNMNEKYSDAMHSLISESARITTFSMELMDKKSDHPEPGHSGNYGYENEGHLGSEKNDVNIYVNSISKYVRGRIWGYEDIVNLAFGVYPDLESDQLQYIVTYGDSDDPERRSGTMKKDESIPVREGTYFIVTEV